MGDNLDMPSLQHLRESRTIIRWMLVWFCMSIGVAFASPAVHPQALTLVCTAAGAVKLVSASDTDIGDATPAGMGHSLDCVMCLPGGAPPVASVTVPLSQALDHVYRATAPTAVQWQVAAKTSARDPPHFS
jgi:hypothetical protein